MAARPFVLLLSLGLMPLSAAAPPLLHTLPAPHGINGPTFAPLLQPPGWQCIQWEHPTRVDPPGGLPTPGGSEPGEQPTGGPPRGRLGGARRVARAAHAVRLRGGKGRGQRRGRQAPPCGSRLAHVASVVIRAPQPLLNTVHLRPSSRPLDPAHPSRPALPATRPCLQPAVQQLIHGAAARGLGGRACLLRP